ncbi:MAG TPA: SDR family NAD(P)-dependent oxidoreductase [Dehalococcoidia bacterium]|jgi:NAD(P)-dependent dehydrogenase (short-subunit alcohol dehydrogenase family)|nr:SDR family NAD(P)-dependent oxidoreductase [Dehalococcoidia bacterium]
MYDLSGKVAIVTGAGGRRGIGRAIATRLAKEGADVVVTDVARDPLPEDADSGWKGIDSVVSEIQGMGRKALGLLSDVTDVSQVREMVERTLGQFGKIDVLVCNAGSQPGGDRRLLVDLEEDAFDLVQRVNVKGTFLCCREVCRHMVDRGGPGKIVIMSSRAGKQGTARYAAYCASKFALIGITEALALEMAPYKVNVNAICPGLVDTERVYYMADALRPEDVSVEEYRQRMLDDRARAVPLGRPAVATDIANTAAFLASDQSDYLTGLSISVSGGLGMS